MPLVDCDSKETHLKDFSGVMNTEMPIWLDARNGRYALRPKRLTESICLLLRIDEPIATQAISSASTPTFLLHPLKTSLMIHARLNPSQSERLHMIRILQIRNDFFFCHKKGGRLLRFGRTLFEAYEKASETGLVTMADSL
jgi:hypothetical protein